MRISLRKHKCNAYNETQARTSMAMMPSTQGSCLLAFLIFFSKLVFSNYWEREKGVIYCCNFFILKQNSYHLFYLISGFYW